jgi:hypothetical protein
MAGASGKGLPLRLEERPHGSPLSTRPHHGRRAGWRERRAAFFLYNHDC